MKAATRPGAAAARLAETLRMAMHAHMNAELDIAEPLYRRVLKLQPAHPDALHYLGVLLHQRGRGDEAVILLGRALRLTPLHADAHCNLGNIHKEHARHAEAEACYRRALALAPDHPQALGNLAIVLEALERVDEAREAYQAWLARMPGDARGHYQFGRFLCSHPRERADVEQAVEHFRGAFALDAGQLRVLEALGMALYGLERIEEAAAVYRDWAAREQDNPIPRHMLAACGAAEAPARAGDDYVRELFDGFAASFDEQLVKNLGYRAPQALIDVLAPVLAMKDEGKHEREGEGEPAGLDILDAGCGTGLCGPLLRAHARELSGVDLSEGMLDQARRRGGYDRLVNAELTAFLQAHPQSWDLIVSADTLVYFGELEALLAAAHAALRPGGHFAFSVETLPGEAAGHALSPSGRYRHGRAYLDAVLVGAGFVEVHVEAKALRREAGRWVDGGVVRARRAH
ncbi:tetratricopeptide repeat protein [Burkholderia gladioli]|uniref:tetratricopeptide repeat protein n=1 Tax=Burkholderia gladioli TaxID=28095 RepID=UPI00163F8657|nr:tetratricopeptide repeat protein [Burkholderia gladioli]